VRGANKNYKVKKKKNGRFMCIMYMANSYACHQWPLTPMLIKVSVPSWIYMTYAPT
jgi:hypothetical protein